MRRDDKWYADPARCAGRPASRAGEGPRLRQARASARSTGKPLLSSNQDLASLRSLQDWYLRYQLTAVPGVAEVASHRRVRQGISGRPQAREAARLQPADQGHHDGRPAIEQRRGRVGRGDERERVHGPQPRIPARADGPGEGAGRRGQGNGTPIMLVRRGDAADRRRRAARHRRVERRRAKRWAASSSPASAPTPIRSSTTPRQSSRSWKTGLPPGVMIKTAYDRSDLIERSDPHAPAHADRGNDRRRAGLHPVPAARPQRAGGDLRRAHAACWPACW